MKRKKPREWWMCAICLTGMGSPLPHLVLNQGWCKAGQPDIVKVREILKIIPVRKGKK